MYLMTHNLNIYTDHDTNSNLIKHTTIMYCLECSNE